MTDENSKNNITILWRMDVHEKENDEREVKSGCLV